MQVDTLLDHVGGLLQENFTASPVWTKTELLGYLKTVLRIFYTATALVDRNRIVLVNGTSGEADAPRDFGQLFYSQFDGKPVDIVTADELDFVQDGWLYNKTGTPRASTVFGSGTNAVVRYVPVPSSVWTGINAGEVEEWQVLDSGSNVWVLCCYNGCLNVIASVGSTDTITLYSSPYYYRVGVSTSGVLRTTQTTATTVSEVFLFDTVQESTIWSMTCDRYGVLETNIATRLYGIAVGAVMDTTGNYQTFLQGANSSDENYGIIVDARETLYPPDYVVRADKPVGLSLFCNTSDETAHLWYTARQDDIGGLYSEVWLSPGLLPIVVHGVLGMAFGHQGDGKDMLKSKFLLALFKAECEMVRQMFSARFV